MIVESPEPLVTTLEHIGTPVERKWDSRQKHEEEMTRGSNRQGSVVQSRVFFNLVFFIFYLLSFSPDVMID